ncbi:MAG: YihY/virulence factor BrkB family protein [Thermodesulfobacteriota bacterium]
MTAKTSTTERFLHWLNMPQPDSSFLTRKLHSLLRILLITVKEFDNNKLNIRASALTYTILLSLVPMLALSTAVVKGLGGGNQLRQAAYTYLDTLEKSSLHADNLPFQQEPAPGKGDEAATSEQGGESLTEHLRSGADQLFDYVDNTNFATLGTFGVLGVLVSAILVLGNIELSMNAIWHVPSGRSLLRKVTDYLTFLILLPLSVNLGFAATAVTKNEALMAMVTTFVPGPWVQTVLLLIGPLIFIILTLFLVYIFFPNTKVKPLSALIGAIFAGTLWLITQDVYIGLQVGVANYNAIYGSFATLPLFLVWMFLGWLFILGGAQLAFAHQRRNSYQLRQVNHSPTEQLSGAFDILSVIFASYKDEETLEKKDLPTHCPAYPADLLFNCLKKLIDAQIVGITEKGRLLPALPAEQLHYREVITTILGNTYPETKGGETTASILKQVEPFLDKSFSSKPREEE